MPVTPSQKAHRTRFEGSVPILRVADLRASTDYYQRVLGFERDWGGDGPFPWMASVSRDGAAVMLCQGAQGRPGTWVWFGVDDVLRLRDEYAARGVKVVLPPTNFSWAMEMRVEDPDGHVLRFGSDADGSRPFEDEKA
jgi:catechol 2,3-dioxygenase-like lactoylglutathione lyase family enzyme